MTGRRIALLAAVAAGVVGVGVGAAWDHIRVRTPDLNAAQAADKPAAAAKDKAPDDNARPADQEAVRAAVKEFIKVFEKGDAKALAALFTEEGEYVSNDGATLRGRAAMEDGYAQFFKKNTDMQLEVSVDSIRFVSQDNAVLEGSARSYKTGKPGDPTLSRISALYVREKGQWLLAMLREWPDEGTTLEDVDWLIGTWESKSDAAEVRTTYEWEDGKKFLRARFTIKEKGKDEVLSGTQLIGRDPRTGQLHSWLFESDGGFGEADWTWDGKAWTLDASGVEPDGDEVTATNILTPLGKDSFTWQSTNRTVDDEDVTDIAPVKVVRVK
ncbi:MAG TPA: SgcJ/EcaC family oxidoreductase [Gemmataceae bacterium]|nr:SgcJ/EcaC family oxidoreductase [Gemmataceae bacterium]